MSKRMAWLMLAMAAAGCGEAADEIPVEGSEQAIVGGTPSAASKWGATVFLETAGQFRCGGTLISPRWVLTAKHCVDKANDPLVRVVAGRKDLTTTAGDDMAIDYSGAAGVPATKVAKVYRHLTSDVALIQLPRAHKVTIAPARLASITEMSLIQDLDNLTVVGWGSTRKDGTGAASTTSLLEVDVPKLSDSYRAECAGTKFCAGGVESEDSCSGDSGGPIFGFVNNEYVQVGLVLGGLPDAPSVCGSLDYPGVYLRTSSVLDWINLTTGGLTNSTLTRDSHSFWAWNAATTLPVTEANRTYNSSSIPSIKLPTNYQAIVGQFGGTAIPDVIVYQPGKGKDYLLINGVATAKEIEITANYEPVVGDFDLNGYSDILWYGQGSLGDKMWWFSSVNGVATITDGTVSMGGNYTPLVGKFDADTRPDIIWYAPGTAADVAWYQTGRNGNALTFTSVAATFNENATALVGNFDGNLYSDIYFYSTTAVDVIRLSTTTRGTFGSLTPTNTLGQTANVNNVYRPFAGDFDGNGFTDIFWYRPYDTGANQSDDWDGIWWYQASGRHQQIAELVNDGEQFWPVVADFSGTAAGAVKTDDILWFKGARPRGQ